MGSQNSYMACDTTTHDHSSRPGLKTRLAALACRTAPQPKAPGQIGLRILPIRGLLKMARGLLAGRGQGQCGRVTGLAASTLHCCRPAPSRAWPTAQGLEYAVPDAAASERALPAQEREPRSKTARGGLRSQLSSISSGPRHLGLGAPRTSSRRPAEPTSQLLSGAAAVRCACCGLWREERSSKRAGRGGRCESILRQRRVAAPAGYRI